LKELSDQFFSFLASEYRAIRPVDVKLITASLFFSLIPLHDNMQHQKQCFVECEHLLEEISTA